MKDEHLKILDEIIRNIPTHRVPPAAAATRDLPERPVPRSLGTPVNQSTRTDDPQPPLGGPNPGPAILRG